MNPDRVSGFAGSRIIAVSWAATLAFAVVSLPAANGADAFEVPAVAVSLALFAAGIGLSLVALARAAVRAPRQRERITVGNLWFLQGSAPKPVRRLLLGSFAVSVVVAVATITTAPFSVLQPMFPLALCAWWGALHGTFPRAADPNPPRRRPPG
ncbi:MAG TPA: hypothetical protein VFS16_12380 [Acidimicrobiia bacterium]|nr:hypothetical protein [Acidimicrobiia bacterium]